MSAEKPKLIAVFQPQVELANRNIVDDGASVQVDITKWFLAQKPATIWRIAMEADKSHGKDLDLIAEASDVLLRRHDGPYRVELDRQDIDAFFEAHGSTIETVDDEAALKALRTKAMVLGYEIPFPVGEEMFNGPQPAVKTGSELVMPLSDWRIEDGGGEDADLTEMQRKPWQVVVSPGGWGASIDFVAPDGTRRSVSIEIDKGNPCLRTYSGGDEVDAIIRIGREATHVTSGASPVGASIVGVLIDSVDGISKAPEDFDADFADSSAPAPR